MMYCFIHIGQTPCYARDRDGITVEVYEVRVGDADPIYMDRIGRTYSGSLCFDTIRDLENFYSKSMWGAIMVDTDDLDFDDTIYISYNCDVDITNFTIFKDYEECIKHCKEHKEFAADEYAFNGVKYVQTKEIYYYVKGVINND